MLFNLDIYLFYKNIVMENIKILEKLLFIS